MKQLYLSSDVTLFTQTPLFCCEHSLSQSNQFLLRNIYFPFYIFSYISDHQSENGLWTASHVDFETFTHFMSILQIIHFEFLHHLPFICLVVFLKACLVLFVPCWTDIYWLGWSSLTGNSHSYTCQTPVPWCQICNAILDFMSNSFLLFLKWLYIGNTLTCSSKRWKYLFG